MKELAALREKIPVLKEFLVGKNIAQRTHGYRIIDFENCKGPHDL